VVVRVDMMADAVAVVVGTVEDRVECRKLFISTISPFLTSFSYNILCSMQFGWGRVTGTGAFGVLLYYFSFNFCANDLKNN